MTKGLKLRFYFEDLFEFFKFNFFKKYTAKCLKLRQKVIICDNREIPSLFHMFFR